MPCVGPVERVFSQRNDSCTAAGNIFTVFTVKAMLIVRTNFIFSCQEFMEKLAKDRAILRKRPSCEKYADSVSSVYNYYLFKWAKVN